MASEPLPQSSDGLKIEGGLSMVNVGRMEKKMETTIMGYTGILFGLYWGYIGIMENKMETTVVYICRLYLDNGKENGNCYSPQYSLGFRPQFSKGVLEPYERVNPKHRAVMENCQNIGR